RLREALAAVHHAVAHRLDLAHARDRHAGVGARQPGDDVLHGCRMIAQLGGRGGRRAGGRFERHDRFAADALDLSARESAMADPSVSISWNLSDDDPTLRTRMCTRELWLRREGEQRLPLSVADPDRGVTSIVSPENVDLRHTAD